MSTFGNLLYEHRRDISVCVKVMKIRRENKVKKNLYFMRKVAKAVRLKN